LWHDRRAVAPARIVLRVVADMAGLLLLSPRARRAVEAENLFLRQTLALFQERGVKPRRVDAATRLSLTLLFRLVDWRDALVVLQPEGPIRSASLPPLARQSARPRDRGGQVGPLRTGTASVR